MNKMNLFFRIGMVSLLLFTFSGCGLLNKELSQNRESSKTQGKIQFSLGGSHSLTQSKNVLSIASVGTPTVSAVLVTIEDSNGNVIKEREKLNLIKVNNSYVSQPTALEVGTYKLTEFMIVNANSDTIYLAPKTGSDRAQYVDHPLPITMEVEKDSLKTVTPDVISVELNDVASNFGYPNFQFNDLTPLWFYLGVQNYTTKAFITANITIKNNGTTLYSGTLANSVNTIRVKKATDNAVYTLSLSKEGFQTIERSLTRDLCAQYQYNALLLTLNRIPESATTGTFVGPTTLSTDTVWTKAQSPYIVQGNILVKSGSKLTIEPGVRVLFDGDYYIQVDGEFVAIGTAENKIIFSSNKTIPQSGDWHGIVFNECAKDAVFENDVYKSGSTIQYAEICYGGTILGYQSSPYLAYNHIHDNKARSFSFGDSLCSIFNFMFEKVRIKNNTFENNKDICIHVWWADFTIIKNTFFNNSGKTLIYKQHYTSINNIQITQNNFYDISSTNLIYFESTPPSKINLTNNYWNGLDVANILTKIYGNVDDFGNSMVDLTPVLMTPVEDAGASQ